MSLIAVKLLIQHSDVRGLNIYVLDLRPGKTIQN